MAVYRQASRGAPMELHAQTSCVFIGGAIFFSFFAAVAMAIGTTTGWAIGGGLMLLPLSLVVMSRRGVTVDPSTRTIVHHNGIGPIKLLKREFHVENSCEIVLLDYDSESYPGGYVVYVRDGERKFNLLMTNDGPDADEFVNAVAEELRLPIIDRHEKRGYKAAVLDSHEQPRHLLDD